MRISTAEFVAIMAMLVATVAISIDGMLPALSIIADELTPLRAPDQGGGGSGQATERLVRAARDVLE